MATSISPIVLITGITGQDGWLSFFLKKNYIVHATVWRTSSLERSRLKDGYEDHTIYNRRLAPALC
jgi:GDP-D-mannose dehydratase